VGGAELVFPHHEAEMAQGEALSGKKPFVKYWVHMGMLNVGRVKMSKSLGNVVRIRDALSAYAPEELRLLFAKTHHRRLAIFSKSGLIQAGRGLRIMREALRQLENCSSRRPAGQYELRLLREVSRLEHAFTAAMDDDFDTARALKLLRIFLEGLRIQLRTRREFDAETGKAILKRIRTLANIIGLDQI
jgi:cysteinyl-tRNA synthetase